MEIDDQDFLREIRVEFLTEAIELVEQCEQCFLNLESNPDDDTIIDEIFRIAHTIKGSAMTVHFDNLGEFAHKFEGVLNGIRSGSIKSSKQIIDVLLIANDTIGNSIRVLTDDRDAVLELEQGLVQLESVGNNNQTTPPISEEKKAATEGATKTNTIEVTPPTEEIENKKTGDNYERIALVVEDQKEIREIEVEMLQNEGFKVFEAEDGREALRFFASGPRPNIVVSDFKMPNMDGLQLTTEIKRIAPKVPVIICSGYAGREDILNFLNIGAYGLLEKPVEQATFISMIHSAYHLFEMRHLVSELVTENNRAYLKLISLTSDILSSHGPEYSERVLEVEERLERVGKITRKVSGI